MKRNAGQAGLDDDEIDDDTDSEIGDASSFTEQSDIQNSMLQAMSNVAPKKKTKGRVKIKMEFIENKLRRYTTFSKRKTGIMKKAYELSTLTGTQVMLLVASETGHVYTFATRKLQPMITSESGKALIQTCLNSPDLSLDNSHQKNIDQRMNPSGFEEPELMYGIAEDGNAQDENAGSMTDEAKSSPYALPLSMIAAGSTGGSQSPSPSPPMQQEILSLPPSIMPQTIELAQPPKAHSKVTGGRVPIANQPKPAHTNSTPSHPSIFPTSQQPVQVSSTQQPSALQAFLQQQQAKETPGVRNESGINGNAVQLNSSNLQALLPQGFTLGALPGNLNNTQNAVSTSSATPGSTQLFRVQGTDQVISLPTLPALSPQANANTTTSSQQPKQSQPLQVLANGGTTTGQTFVYQTQQGYMYAQAGGLGEGVVLSIPNTPTGPAVTPVTNATGEQAAATTGTPQFVMVPNLQNNAQVQSMLKRMRPVPMKAD